VPPHACSKGNSEPSKGLPSAIMSTYAYGINDKGVIVGSILTGPGDQLAVIIWAAGAPTDLNSLLASNPAWYLKSALGVNNHGDIVGLGYSANGLSRPFLLTSPEARVSDVNAVNTVAQVMKILAGVVSDSGGAGLPLQFPIPIPIPPWGPEFMPHLIPSSNITAGRALLRTAEMIGNSELRFQVESIARRLLGSQRHVKSAERDRRGPRTRPKRN
jgi:hypothetical protein